MNKLWKKNSSTGKWEVIETSPSLEAVSLAMAHCQMFDGGISSFYVQADGAAPPEGVITDEQS